MIDDDLCSFCKLVPEKIVHLFYECPVVQQLWQNVAQYCLEKFNTAIQLNPINVKDQGQDQGSTEESCNKFHLSYCKTVYLQTEMW